MSICHNPDQLRAFRCGQIDNAAEVDQIAEHLAVCRRCQECFDTCADSPLCVLLDEVDLASTSTVKPSSPTAFTTPDWNDVPPPLSLVQHPKWECLSVLGKGGMGVVYLARHRHLQEKRGVDRLRALKILQISLLAGKNYADRFYREIQIVTRLPEHPHIVQAYDVERLGDYFVLEMEFVPGQNLEEFAKSFRTEANELGRIPTGRACGFILQALSGLTHASQHGIVHRDLKPENLMVMPDQRVKILDFGLAKVCSDGPESTRYTLAGIQGCGSPKYLSPEQSQDFAKADIRSDLYALGCTLYRLISGHPPFGEHTGHSGTVDILTAHKKCRPLPLSTVCSDVPHGLSKVVDRLLEKQPEKRFKSSVTAARALAPFADEFAQKLTDKWLQESPIETESNGRRRDGRQYRIAALILMAILISPWLLNWQTIFQVRTKAGLVEFELDDPNVDIWIDDRAIDKTQVKVRSRGEKTWLVVNAMQGQRELRVSRPGFEVFSENVVVRAGESAPVRVRLNPLKRDAQFPARPGGSDTSLLGPDFANAWDLKGSLVTSVTFLNGILATHNTGAKDYEDHLVTRKTDFQNFRLKYEVRIADPQHTAVVMFRVDPSPMVFGGMRGYEVTIRPKVGDQPGSIQLDLGSRARGELVLKKTESVDLTASRWIPVEIVVEGERIRVYSDGQFALEYEDPGPTFQSGAIALRFLSGVKMEFRNVAIHELPDTPLAAERMRWSYLKAGGNEWNEIWGVFAQVSDKKWFETVTFPTQYHRFEFREVNRTGDYIELQRTTNEGQYFFRIFADRADMGPTLDQLQAFYRGSWGTEDSAIPEKDSPAPPRPAPAD